jgi:N-acetylmuramoyl-L-alanine amidase
MKMIEIKQRIIPPGRRNRPVTFRSSGIYGIKMAPRYITIHNTGNRNATATAAGHANWLATARDLLPGYHFTVDDLEAWQHLPLDEAAWHCGDGLNGTGNRESIGIEICENALPGDMPKYLRAENNGAWLAAKLISGQKTLLPFPGCLKQHWDWSRKNCPSVIRARNSGWQEFITKVQDHLQKSNDPGPQPTPGPQQQDVWYRVVAGSYRDRNNAEMVRRTLLAQGISAFIDIHRG